METAFEIDYLPELEDPIFIAGFEGWGNALDISSGMTDYLLRKLDGRLFAKLRGDLFYNFEKNRPVVEIEEGLLKEITLPAGFFFTIERRIAGRDIILLKATEPSLRWSHFVGAVLELCRKTGVKSIISLGSMFDEVLHTDLIISALASSEELLARLKEKKVITANYKGPTAIQSALLAEARKQGFESMSLWCHCPYYLQGTTHFGLMSHLGSLLASLYGFSLDTRELEIVWKELLKQIQNIIDKNSDLQNMINDLRKAKLRGSWNTAKKHDKVIHLEDFFRPR